MDLAEVAERLGPFCRDAYGDPDVAVGEVTKMPGHAGFAYGFAATSRGRTERWFLRLPPPGARWRGTADMGRQVTALRALEGSDVPHCRVRWSGGPEDLEWFGCPYFVVDQLEGGSVVGMGGSGWVLELPEAGRSEMARQAMAALAGVHRVDWRARCGYLGEPVPLDDDVTRWDRLADKAAGPAMLAHVPRLRRLLLDQVPTGAPVGLFHGDYQFGNLYYATDGTLEAVLDWELCGVGATLNDVGWMATFNDPEAWDHEGAVPEAMPRAPELVDHYEAAWGARLPDVTWYRALAAYKFAIIAGFNLGLHLRGKRHDPLWERIGRSTGSLQERALQLLT
ncbi:MAG: phosphotransferase [Acidimicrobiia bacterium]|nr:phosphotransferase [Acidimicrobiia bacterium]